MGTIGILESIVSELFEWDPFSNLSSVDLFISHGSSLQIKTSSSISNFVVAQENNTCSVISNDCVESSEGKQPMLT